MDDTFGLKAAAERGITPRTGRRQDFCSRTSISACGKSGSNRVRPSTSHPYHPYLVVSLAAGQRNRDYLGKRSDAGAGRLFRLLDEMRECTGFTNKSNVTYLSRLIEMKAVTWTTYRWYP